MRRDPRAFLNDVIEAGSAIVKAVDGIGLDGYSQSRLIRSSVEREFTIIGEALTQLAQRDRALFEQIGVRGLVVHAASAAAREFYLYMGFDPSPSDPNTLLLRLVDIAAALKA